MKKFSICILLSFLFILSGCSVIEYNSLDEYKELMKKHGIGYSDVGIDSSDELLPSNTFLYDYEYLEGSYYYYDNEVFNLPNEHYMPDRTLITLKYDNEKYYKAKECVLENIPQYGDYFYTYNNYQFYFNKNSMDRHYDEHPPEIFHWFTMACYNDENNMICFLGFNKTYHFRDDKYLNDLDNNWEAFIDEYYGEYFDFSK